MHILLNECLTMGASQCLTMGTSQCLTMGASLQNIEQTDKIRASF